MPVGAAITSLGTAAAVQSGIGVISEVNADVQEGAEDTAEAIVELLKPRMEDQAESTTEWQLTV
jgi:hypothetical protein